MQEKRKIDNFYLLLYGVNMKKSKKILILVFILIVLSFICKLLLSVNTINYKLKYKNNNFEIKEIYRNKNYYLEVKTEKYVFPIRIYNNLSNKRKIINEIYYYEDENYKCLLPIIDNQVIVDMMCYKDDIIYNYHDIIGENKKLDDYISSIELYDIKQFKDDVTKIQEITPVKIFNTNINHVIAITTYKGLISSNEEINLFEKDIYNNKISTFINNYYVIADYNKTYEFNYFYVVNLENNEVFKIKSKNEISLDSYIQGIVDNKIYLYDKDNECQYEIDIKNKKVELIASEDNIKYYKNNKWEKINRIQANKEMYFDYTSLDNDFSDYDYVVKTLDYYYLFEKDGENYKLYKLDINNQDILKFILKVPTTDINFKDNYLYYVDNNKLYYYSEETGLKTLLENSEFQFNNTIKYYIY